MKKATSIPDEFLGHRNELPCISIIVPTHRRSPDRSTDRLQVEKAVLRAKSYMVDSYPDQAVSLHSALDNLLAQVDYVHQQAGIGFFVAPGYARLVHFFMPVKERIIFGDSFLIRELLQDQYFGDPYLVLQLSEHAIQVFDGQFDQLTEVHDEHFPMHYVEEYQYSRPTRGSSYVGNAFVKGFERDKSQLEEIRMEQFFHKGDLLLSKYLTDGKMLIVAGTERDLGSFKQVTKHAAAIVGWLTGHYGHTGDALPQLAWNRVQEYLTQRSTDFVTAQTEKDGQSFVAGITDIWNAVNEGRGYQLLVEKDYSEPAFLSNDVNGGRLYLHPPKEAHTILPDPVNELMIRMLKRGGTVIQVANDSLRSNGRIALVTRY